MASIRERDGKLFFDFRYMGIRCRELTSLKATKANQKKLETILKKIEAEIAEGTFDYARYFPQSKTLEKVRQKLAELENQYTHSPTFKQFATQWFEEMKPAWRHATAHSYLTMLDLRILPFFG